MILTSDNVCCSLRSTIERYNDNFVARYRANMIQKLLVVTKEVTRDLAMDFQDEMITEISMAAIGVPDKTKKEAKENTNQPLEESIAEERAEEAEEQK